MPTTPPRPFAALRGQYQSDKQALLAGLLAPQRRSAAAVRGALQRLTRLADRALLQLWQAHGLHQTGLALVAVGGFGRKELFPHSDIDVLVLLPDAAMPDAALPNAALPDGLQDRIAAFVRACWDVGLDIGSSTRTVAECLQTSAQDITVQTALLERRLLAGSAALYHKLDAACAAAMQPYAFYQAKMLEMRQRHTRFDNTPYALEPDCKESPGGLRDLHVVRWVARAAGFGSSWDALHQQGLVTQFELRQLRRAQALLHLVRLHLHMAAARREDKLMFDLQEQVAQQLLVQPAASNPAVNNPAANQTNQPQSASQSIIAPMRSSERLMRRYYRAAKAVMQLSQIVLLNLADRLREQSRPAHAIAPVLPAINPRFLDNNGLLEVASDQLYMEQPHSILETFWLCQQQAGISGLSARTLRALYNARPVMDSAFRADPVNRQQFLRLLQAPRGVAAALQLMNQTSVLEHYLLAFRKIVGQMQHDLFHVYTVDQHTLRVVRNVRNYFSPDHAHENPLWAQLAAGCQSPWLLTVAALFHDIAKGRGGDHSVLGERELRLFARQHHIGAEDTELMAFLVREHLTLSKTAQKQDLGNPAVIAQFAQKMGSERRLAALYLLTVADIRGTSPKVWSSWKAKLLQDLYLAARDVLGGHVPDRDSLLVARRSGALIEMARQGLPLAGHLKLWQTLDAGYFMRHQASEIAWHTGQIARHASQGKTIVRARLAPHANGQEGQEGQTQASGQSEASGQGGLEVLVYTPDQEALFARICGFFQQASFSILDARAHTSSDGYALDTFQVINPHLVGGYAAHISTLQTALTRALEQAAPLPELRPTRLSRRAKNFPLEPFVHIQPEEGAQRWHLTIHASDRIGLLYSIARVLANHGVRLQLAKISTMGDRVEDTFLIEGNALQSPQYQAALERDLLAAVTG